MTIPEGQIKTLKQIVLRDHGIQLSDEQAQAFGASLLRLTRIGATALARAGDKKLSAQAREENSLEPKTST